MKKADTTMVEAMTPKFELGRYFVQCISKSKFHSILCLLVRNLSCWQTHPQTHKSTNPHTNNDAENDDEIAYFNVRWKKL